MELIDKYIELAQAAHPVRAVAMFSEAEVTDILIHYYQQCKPLKADCSNATPAELFSIVSMCKAYDHLFRENPKVPALKATACSLAQSLDRVGRYLKGRGLINDKFINLNKL